MAGERLAQILTGLETHPQDFPDVIYGTVLSISPLQIQIQNEKTMILSDAFLILSPFCKAQSFPIPSWNTSPEASHTHSYTDSDDGSTTTKTTGSGTSHLHSIPLQTVQLWRGLEPGDVVIMLSVSRGQKYYVMERFGGDLNATTF